MSHIERKKHKKEMFVHKKNYICQEKEVRCFQSLVNTVFVR